MVTFFKRLSELFLNALNNDARSFLSCVCMALMVLALLCLVYMGLLFWQGYPDATNAWLMSAAFIAGGPLEMAQAHMARPSNKKTTHFAILAVNTAFATYFSWTLLDTNPWLVCSVLSLCLLLHVYIGAYLFYSVGGRRSVGGLRLPRISPLLAGLVSAQLGIVSFALVATRGQWLISVAVGLAAAAYGWRLWYNLRQNTLSDEQHPDIWSKALRQPETTNATWVHLQCYLIVNEEVPYGVLKATVAKLDTPELLEYFDTALQMNRPGVARLTQVVQDRLCELDPDAAIVFDMHCNDKVQAAKTLTQMRASGVAPQESFALPNLDA